ncbi:aminopeptidase P family N-terminal domain-containing protein, partial [Agrobacterium sp.]
MADFQETLKRFQPIAVSSIAEDELRLRIRGLQARMIQDNIKAVWLDASSSLTYYTGLSLGLSERIHGALVPAEGAPIYISPTFEEPKLQTLIRIKGEVAVWEEDENPFDLMAGRVAALSCPGHLVAIDPATPFVFASALMQRLEGRIMSAQPM